jgi:hypothetical protein
MTEYVQAWECTGPFNGYVYDSGVMLDKMALGCDIVSVTFVRHADGSREYLPNTIAAEVRALREGRTHE